MGQTDGTNIPDILYSGWGKVKVASDNEIKKENNLYEMKDYNDRNKLWGRKENHFFTLFILLIHEIETLMGVTS